ncbi:MAG TPA: hypothetical protein ENF37_08260 [Beggiatoa sp.]|nr:hypothetical protein [Beggiatoa sp.]
MILRWATKRRYPPYIDLLGPATKRRYPPYIELKVGNHVTHPTLIYWGRQPRYSLYKAVCLLAGS